VCVCVMYVYILLVVRIIIIIILALQYIHAYIYDALCVYYIVHCVRVYTLCMLHFLLDTYYDMYFPMLAIYIVK